MIDKRATGTSHDVNANCNTCSHESRIVRSAFDLPQRNKREWFNSSCDDSANQLPGRFSEIVQPTGLPRKSVTADFPNVLHQICRLEIRMLFTEAKTYATAYMGRHHAPAFGFRRLHTGRVGCWRIRSGFTRISRTIILLSERRSPKHRSHGVPESSSLPCFPSRVAGSEAPDRRRSSAICVRTALQRLHSNVCNSAIPAKPGATRTSPMAVRQDGQVTDCGLIEGLAISIGRT